MYSCYFGFLFHVAPASFPPRCDGAQSQYKTLVCPPTLSAVFQVEELCGDLCGLEPVHSIGITESGGWLRVWLHLLVWYYICLFWTLGVMGLST